MTHADSVTSSIVRLCFDCDMALCIDKNRKLQHVLLNCVISDVLINVYLLCSEKCGLSKYKKATPDISITLNKKYFIFNCIISRRHFQSHAHRFSCFWNWMPLFFYLTASHWGISTKKAVQISDLWLQRDQTLLDPTGTTAPYEVKNTLVAFKNIHKFFTSDSGSALTSWPGYQLFKAWMQENTWVTAVFLLL